MKFLTQLKTLQSSRIVCSKGTSQRIPAKKLSTQSGEDRIVKSPAPYLNLPKGNFVNTIFANFHKWSSKTALECAATKRKLTFADLEAQTSKWAGFLKQNGVGKGDIVTIIAPNCLEFPPLFYGTASTGAAVSPINWKSTPDEIRRMIEITQSGCIIFAKETERPVIEAFQGKTDNLQLFSIGKSNELKSLNVSDILEGREKVATSSPIQLSGEENLYLPFSSGTTGPPKAAALSHNAFIASTHQFCNPFHDNMRETTDNFQEVIVALLPFFHIYGMGVILSTGLFNGNKIVILPHFERNSFLNTIINYKATRLHIVPTILNLLNNSPECNPETMRHVDSVLCGAAPVHESAADHFRQKIGKKNLPFFEGYGMTEALITNLTSRKFLRLGTCGHLLSNVEAKVINQETGQLLGELERGEVCVKTPAMMTEYVNNPKGTADIIRDGWVHTGDVGYYDEEGRFYIVDRTKDLIKVKGLQVSPSEIEEELSKHPSVQECCVVGLPDDISGEIPKAFVVTKEEVSATELNKFLLPKLSKHKQLTGGISFVDSLPKSETGKVLRRVLRDQA